MTTMGCVYMCVRTHAAILPSSLHHREAFPGLFWAEPAGSVGGWDLGSELWTVFEGELVTGITPDQLPPLPGPNLLLYKRKVRIRTSVNAPSVLGRIL